MKTKKQQPRKKNYRKVTQKKKNSNIWGVIAAKLLYDILKFFLDP